jgi:hypothetical protein
MTIDLASAVAFTTNHARVLDRHRLQVLLDPDDSVAARQALDALAGYRNADAGYGWGLEPDLRSPESQPSTALHAFEVWAEIGSRHSPEAEQLCDWLASVSLADGGLPFALPVTDPVGCAPWWVGAESSVSSLQITAAVAANAHRAARHDQTIGAHPWLHDATRYCLDAIAALESNPPAYVLSFSLRLLDAVADTMPEAHGLIEHLLGLLPPDGLMPVEGGADGEMLRPLDYAPEPDTAVRRLLPREPFAADLQRLGQLQQPDGGWPINWAVSSPAAALEWRGYVTVRAVGELDRNGQLS